jgi:hypothetical protein
MMNKKQLKATIEKTGNAVNDATAAVGEKLHGLATNVESTIKRYRDKTGQKLADTAQRVKS